MMEEIRAANVFRISVRRTGAEKNDTGDVDPQLLLHNVLEHPAVDEEWLGVVNGSVSFSLLGSVLVLEIPVPFEFL
jgi:hypothetical protein